MRRFVFLPVLLLFGFGAVARGQQEPMLDLAPEDPKSFRDLGSVSAEVSPAKAKRGEVVTIKLTVTPKLGARTYPVNVPPEQAGKNRLPPDNGVLIFSEVTDPAGWDEKKSDDRPFGKDRVYFNAVTWELKAWVNRDAKTGKTKIDLLEGGHIQLCTKSCLNAREADLPPLDFEVLDGEPVKLSAADEEAYQKSLQRNPPEPVLPKKDHGITPTPVTPAPKNEKTETLTGIIRKTPVPVEEHTKNLTTLQNGIEKQEVKREGGISALLLTAAFWGLVSLATPCVFPMIPITVSLFLKQSNQSTGGAIKLATVYSLTIVLVLGASAVFLLSIFRELSVDPWMNLFLGTLFVVFALSLFGMFDITLPNFLLRGAESRRKQGGMVGTIFGAIAFSIVSFTCVAPFLGGFAGMAASGQYSQAELILAGVTFASAFAAPFFLLALFPRLLKALPKSGGWLDSVKVVMGFLEVAAALKFFRTAEIRWSSPTTLFTYDLVIAGWVVIALACGLYLLNMFRLPHDEEKGHIGVPRLMFALLFLGLAVYLLPAAFKSGEENNRPRGIVFAWVDAFLLPEPGGAAEFPWNSDLPDALARARTDSSKKLVFVDFTGETCTNCKANEKNVFPKPQVRNLLNQYQLASMYTDDVPAEFYAGPVELRARRKEGKANLEFQKAVFGTEQLPLYAILQPTPTGAKVLATYPGGLIGEGDVAGFVEFLKAPLGK